MFDTPSPQRPEESGRDGNWRPRRQSPADSYTSMRVYREAAQRARQSGEIPIVRPGDEDEAPLPRPGAPLFGSRGLMTGPQVAVRLSDAPGEPSPAVAPFKQSTGPQPIPPSFDPPVPPRRFPQRDEVEAPPASQASPSWEEFEAAMLHPPVIGRERSERADGKLTATQVAVAVAEHDAATRTAERPIARMSLGRRVGQVLRHRPSRRATMITVSLLLAVATLVLAGHPLLTTFSAGRVGKSPRTPATGIHATSSATSALEPVYTATPLNVDHPPPVLWAESAVVMDETNGTILYAKNPNEELPMASTTKLMTAVVALSHGNPDQIIAISPVAATTGGARIDLHTGEQYTLRDLLYGMLMISGNDAAEAIATGLAGNEATFVGWMNDTAKALGLTHTHYMNPHGLDDNGHYSSAHDLAVLGRYALSLPLLHQISGTHEYTVAANATHPAKPFQNLHEPLWWYPEADGGKPGWTDNAQFVDVLSAVRDGHHLVGVIMHSANDWVTDIRSILNWGFDDYTWISPRDIDKQHWIPFDDSYDHFSWDVPWRAIIVPGRAYFPYTGYDVSGAFLTYFNAQGGLNTFGFPRGLPTPGASGLLTQRFDKATIACTLATGACQTTANP